MSSTPVSTSEVAGSALSANKRQRKAGNTNFIQQKLTNYAPCPGFQEALVQWLILTYQPLRTVESEAFREMIHSANKLAPVFSYEEICSLISTKYYASVHSVKKILKDKMVALTTDSWTSYAMEGYVTYTLHFIEPKSWTLHHFSLGIFQKDGYSTSAGIVRCAEGHMENFGVTYPQLTCVVTDTESTMVAAGQLFTENSKNAGGTTSWHGCVDHILELVTNIAFKDVPGCLSTMKLCRSLVTFFDSFPQATSKLKEKTKEILGVSLTVIQDVCSSWWSTFTMCEWLLRLKAVLTIMSLEGDLRIVLSEAQWTIVKDLTVLLKPFMIAQRLLEGETYVTISVIPYMLYKIRSSLTKVNADPDSSDQVKTISRLMLQKFEEEFGSGTEHTVATGHLSEGLWKQSKGIPKLCLISMYLDPRTKSGVGVPTGDREMIWIFLERELIDLALEVGPPPIAVPPILEPYAEDRSNQNGIKAAAQRNYDVDEFLDELHNNNIDDEDYLHELNDANDRMNIINAGEHGIVQWNRDNVTRVVQLELYRYKAERGTPMINNITGKFNCPLEWWRLHKSDYYYLTKLAAKLLCIPATSALSERLATAEDDRAGVDSDMANELVFLHDCLPAIEKYEQTHTKAD